MEIVKFTLQQIVSILMLLASIILASIFYLCRLFVLAITKLCHFDYECIADVLDVFFIADDIYGKPEFTVSPYLVLAGQVDSVYFNQRFLKTFILQDGPNSNGYAYNRFQQYPDLFLGYHFWKWDREFDLNNHILYFNGNDEEINEGNLNQSLSRVLRKPYRKGRPLWEINVISNFNGDLNKTLLVFRFHHAIMDGISFVKLFTQGFMDYPTSNAETPSLNTTKEQFKSDGAPFWRNALGKLSYVLTAPIQAWRELKELDDDNIMLERKKSQKPGSDWWVGSTSKFNLAQFTAIKNSLIGVCLSSLVLSGISAGLNAYMVKYFQEKELPTNIHFLNPAPLPGHSDDKLTNYFAMAPLNMKLSAETVVERIETMNKDFLKCRHAVFPVAGFFGMKIIGLLPTFIVDRARKFGKYTCTFSNLPGPKTKSNVFGYVIDDLYAALPLPVDAPALSFVLPSYAGCFRIFVTADKGFVETQAKLDELCSLISTELNKLLLHFQRQS